MKLTSNLFTGAVELEENRPVSLVIEHPGVFRRFVAALAQNDEDGAADDDEMVLEENGEVSDIAKTLYVIRTFVPFELNDKDVLTPLLKRLERVALSPAHVQETRGMLREITRRMRTWALDLPVDVQFEKATAASLVKAMGPEFSSHAEDWVGRVFERLLVVREMLGVRAFVFVNGRSFFTQEELERLLELVLPEKLQVLFLDSSAWPKLQDERRYIIDTDRCEIGFEEGV